MGLFTGVRDISVGELKHNVVGLAKAAKLLGLPIVPITTARDSMWGPTIQELKEALGGATGMVEIMADNADPKALDVYAALDMPFATLMGQVAAALAT